MSSWSVEQFKNTDVAFCLQLASVPEKDRGHTQLARVFVATVSTNLFPYFVSNWLLLGLSIHCVYETQIHIVRKIYQVLVEK